MRRRWMKLESDASLAVIRWIRIIGCDGLEGNLLSELIVCTRFAVPVLGCADKEA